MTLRLHDLRPSPGAKRRIKRIGRGYGSGHGGHESGRGTKGQKSRSGGGVRPTFEGGQTPFWMRFPKRGFNNPFGKRYTVINVGALEEHFEPGELVTVDRLLERRLISKVRDGVKVLGDGELTKPLTVQAHKFSRSAVQELS